MSKEVNPKIERLTENLDRYLAILGLIFAAVFTLWFATTGKPLTYILIGIISFGACLAYLVVRRRLSPAAMPSEISSFLSRNVKLRTYLILNIVFFSLLTYNIASIAFRPEPDSRPLGYFISIALMAALLAIEVVFLPKRKSYTYFVLLKIMVIALSLRLVITYMFPSHVWYDPWFHEAFTQDILNLGRIPQGQDYSNLPIMHLLSGAVMLVTDLDFRIANIFQVTLLQTMLLMVFTFLLGERFLRSAKIGLLAALFLGVADVAIARSITFYPTSLAVIFVFMIIYALFRAREQSSVILALIGIFSMAVLILTHTITALFMAIILFVFWLGFELHKGVYKASPDIPISPYTSALFTVSMLGWWMYASGHFVQLARLFRWGFSKEFLEAPPPEPAVQYAAQVPVLEPMLDRMGFFLFFALAIIGALYLFSRAAGNKHGFVIALGGLVTLFIGFFATPLGLRVIEPRWHFFSQIMLVIPAAFGIILISMIARSGMKRILILAIIISIMSFSMITDIIANFDTPVFSEYRTVRRAFTESEMKSMDTISNIWAGTIGSDMHADRYFSYGASSVKETTPISDSLVSGDFTSSTDMMVVIREYVRNKPFAVRDGTVKLDYDPNDALASQGFNHIYESGSAGAWLFSEPP